MITVLMAGALLVSLPLQQQPSYDTDTTIAVPAGTRLKLDDVGGEIIIRAWDKNQVRIQASHSSRTVIGINLSESSLRLSPRGSRGIARMGGVVDYALTVPASMAIEIGGMYADVTIEGTKAEVLVNTVEGNISVKGGGDLQLSTVNGKISVSGARGRLELHSVSEDIEISDVQGDITAETVSGDMLLSHIDAKRVDVQTVSGDVGFDGILRPDGTYGFLTHSGDVVLSVPENTSALIRTAVANGDVHATFQLPASDRSSRRRQEFRLGGGGASVELETFSGDIRLVRPSEFRTRIKDKDKEN